MTFTARIASWTGLNRAPGLKLALKNGLYSLEDLLDQGIPLEVGGVNIRVPARFRRQPWTDYETPSTTTVAQWLAKHPNAAVLDIGCSVGLYSLLTLAASPQTTAWAFDADLVSLRATLWLCEKVGTDRLHPIFGFVAEQSDTTRDALTAAADTAGLLTRTKGPREPSLCNYVCLDGKDHPHVPSNSIDQLFPDADTTRPWLLKCDVEGAEMLVLLGADRFVRQARPQLLISVHPDTLVHFGYKKEDIAQWIDARGYQRRILSIDHEEHWWCEPISM